MRCAIFANGQIQNYKDIIPLLKKEDVIVAADGGVKHLAELKILPNAVIGDLDSSTSKDLLTIKHNNIPIIKFNKEKDQSDLELAIRYAIDIGCDEIIIFGALGKRWDHSIGNLLLPIQKDFRDIDFQLWENGEHFYYIKNTLDLQIPTNTNVSLFPLIQSKKIVTEGLKFPLTGDPLIIGEARGLSNLSIETNITITINGGLLLVIVGSSDKNNL